MQTGRRRCAGGIWLEHVPQEFQSRFKIIAELAQERGGHGAAVLFLYPTHLHAQVFGFEQVNYFVPEVRPIPLPTDLQWPADIPESRRDRSFRRFSVAYGLSFDRANLDDHRFPQDMPPLPVEPDTPPERPQAPTKDEC